MKFYKDENGKFIIDGDFNTVIYPQKGEHWIDVSDELKDNTCIINFTVQGQKENDQLQFGDRLNDDLVFIGVDHSRKDTETYLAWDTKKEIIILRTIQNPKSIELKIKKSIWQKLFNTSKV